MLFISVALTEFLAYVACFVSVRNDIVHKIASIVITTISSTRVKPRCFLNCMGRKEEKSKIYLTALYFLSTKSNFMPIKLNDFIAFYSETMF